MSGVPGPSPEPIHDDEGPRHPSAYASEFDDSLEKAAAAAAAARAAAEPTEPQEESRQLGTCEGEEPQEGSRQIETCRGEPQVGSSRQLGTVADEPREGSSQNCADGGGSESLPRASPVPEDQVFHGFVVTDEPVYEATMLLPYESGAGRREGDGGKRPCWVRYKILIFVVVICLVATPGWALWLATQQGNGGGDPPNAAPAPEEIPSSFPPWATALVAVLGTVVLLGVPLAYLLFRRGDATERSSQGQSGAGRRDDIEEAWGANYSGPERVVATVPRPSREMPAGIHLVSRGGRLLVRSVDPAGPYGSRGLSRGLRAGMVVTRICGVPVAGMTPPEVVAIVREAEGSVTVEAEAPDDLTEWIEGQKRLHAQNTEDGRDEMRDAPSANGGQSVSSARSGRSSGSGSHSIASHEINEPQRSAQPVDTLPDMLPDISVLADEIKELQPPSPPHQSEDPLTDSSSDMSADGGQSLSSARSGRSSGSGGRSIASHEINEPQRSAQSVDTLPDMSPDISVLADEIREPQPPSPPHQSKVLLEDSSPDMSADGGQSVSSARSGRSIGNDGGRSKTPAKRRSGKKDESDAPSADEEQSVSSARSGRSSGSGGGRSKSEMMAQPSPPPPTPPFDVSPTRRTPPPRRGRRLSMERMVRRASIEGVSAALGLSRPTAPSAPPEPVKRVQFGGVEEKLISFDWDLADDYFYTREQLRAMNNLRFEDASKLRAKMLKKESHSDDSVLTRKSATGNTNQLLSDIINDRDEWDTNISLDGIEPFVFLELKEEMVKKKAIVKKEIIDFVKANKSDPQGWRLASHSRFHTQWARGIAQDKARSLHEALVDESKNLSKKTELEKLKESQEILDGSIRAMRDRGSAPTPPRRGVAGRRPQRRASVCAQPSSKGFYSASFSGGKPTPVEKVNRAQLQQLTKMFSLSESDDDDDSGGGDGAPTRAQLQQFTKVFSSSGSDDDDDSWTKAYIRKVEGKKAT